MGKFTIKVESSFDSAHFLQGTGTKCDQLHGHRWTVWTTLSSEKLTSKGWVVNFTDVKKWVNDLIEKYDHNLLNFYVYQPTAENLCFVIFRHLYHKVAEYNHNHKIYIALESIEIAETPGNTASYVFTGTGSEIKKIAQKQTIKMRPDWEKEAVCRRHSEAHKKVWKDKEKRKNILKGLRKANKDPQLRKHRSERMKENNPMFNRKIVEKMVQSLRKVQKQSPNKGEKKIIRFFKKHKLPFRFVGDGVVIIDGKCPDFINDKHKIIVEYNGRFWHSDDNPWCDVKDDSKDRIKFFAKRGYRTYIIWNDEFESKKKQIRKDLKSLLKT